VNFDYDQSSRALSVSDDDYLAITCLNSLLTLAESRWVGCCSLNWHSEFGQYLPAGVTIQFQWLRYPVTQPNVRYSASKLTIWPLHYGQEPPDETKVPMATVQPIAGVGCGEFRNRTNRERFGARCLPYPTALSADV